MLGIVNEIIAQIGSFLHFLSNAKDKVEIEVPQNQTAHSLVSLCKILRASQNSSLRRYKVPVFLFVHPSVLQPFLHPCPCSAHSNCSSLETDKADNPLALSHACIKRLWKAIRTKCSVFPVIAQMRLSSICSCNSGRKMGCFHCYLGWHIWHLQTSYCSCAKLGASFVLFWCSVSLSPLFK